MEGLNEAKKFIEESENITLLPSFEFEEEVFPATLALFYSLKKLGKNVNLSAPKFPEKFGFLMEKENLLKGGADFLISIREKGVKLSQLFYEKTEEGLNLYFKTEGGELRENDISLKGLNRSDLAIVIGIQSLSELNGLQKTNPALVVNINKEGGEENFGNLNLIFRQNYSFSEIIFEILSLFGQNLFNESTSNSLLAGIGSATFNFQNQKISPKTIERISELIKRGGDFKKVVSNLCQGTTKPAVSLLERALFKIENLPRLNTSLTLITLDDFKETNSRPKDIVFSLEKLTSGANDSQNLVFLWETDELNNLGQGIFYSASRSLAEKIKNETNGLEKGKGILFGFEEPLEETKEKILNIIKQQLI